MTRRLRGLLDASADPGLVVDELLCLMLDPPRDVLDVVYEAARARMREEHGIVEGSDLDFLDRDEFERLFLLNYRTALTAARLR